MKNLLAAVLSASVLLTACDRQPYVEHKVSLEKKADDCAGVQLAFRLNSNFGGERYEFEKCLPATYDKSLIISERRGDTVVVKFGLPGKPYESARYTVALDIDSYPRYDYITIDDETYPIRTSEK
ncbi:hypothetical protein LZZ85_15335 [Terrimonas sp. NA20]|uniref:Lipoprotein n=1 Tax=Terrimonas ginsenosidimutans TaxID=2908004 RepID=A0ABS9KTR6_9BACT|nr:hypothetical protein [Terrimonas ginsenosidimutans]MCG2615673.1 hypothetical protein [Terrimonas ginsenosidimutans]